MLVDIVNPLSLPFFKDLDKEIKNKVKVLKKVKVDRIPAKCSFIGSICFYISLNNFLKAILEQYNGKINEEFHNLIWEITEPLRGKIDSGFIFSSENIKRNLRKAKRRKK